MMTKTNALLVTALVSGVLTSCQSGFDNDTRVSVSPAIATRTSEAMDRGRDHFEAGRYGLALAEFRSAVASDPMSVSALNALAATYDQIQRFDLADRYYQRALAQSPNNAQTLNNLGYSNMLRGRYDVAAVYLREAELADASDETVSGNLAAASNALEERAESSTVVEVASEMAATEDATTAILPDAQTDPDRVVITADPPRRDTRTASVRIEALDRRPVRNARRFASRSTESIEIAPSSRTIASVAENQADAGATITPLANRSYGRETSRIAVAVGAPARTFETTYDTLTVTAAGPTIDAPAGDEARIQIMASRSPAQRPAGPATESIQFAAAAARSHLPIGGYTETVSLVGFDPSPESTQPDTGERSSATRADELVSIDVASVSTPVRASMTETTVIRLMASRPDPAVRRNADAVTETILLAAVPPARQRSDERSAEIMLAAIDPEEAMETSVPVNDPDPAPVRLVEPVQTPAFPFRSINREPVRVASTEPWTSFVELETLAFILGDMIEQPRTVRGGPAESMEASDTQPAPLQRVAALTSEPRRIDRSVVAAAGTSPAIEVSNGTGRSRMASRMRGWLRERGMEVARLTNADHYSHMQSTIFHRDGFEDEAMAMAASLPIDVRVERAVSQASDIRLELGGDLLEFDRELIESN